MDSVELLITGPVARLTLNRPSVKNALRPSDWQLLRSHTKAIKAAGARVIVLDGAAGVFSTGGDLKTMPERLQLAYEPRLDQLKADGAALVDLMDLNLPIVSLIDGWCSGAGLALALLGHLRLATEASRFSAPFLKVGLTGDFGTRYLLERAIGVSRTTAMFLLGTTHDGRSAEQIGLVHRVLPDRDTLQREGAAVVETLLEHPPLALTSVLAALSGKPEQLADAIAWDAREQALCSQTHDAKEGVAAFLAKRAPRFTGE